MYKRQDIVIYRIISFSGNVCLALGSSFDSLQVFDALQTSIFLVEPLVDGFDTFSIHNERIASIGYTAVSYTHLQNAEFIIKREVKVPQITPENLTAALTEQGILEPGTEVLSLKKRTEDGKELMDLDFNEKFRETLFSLGTSGERIFMGLSLIHIFFH